MKCHVQVSAQLMLLPFYVIRRWYYLLKLLDLCWINSCSVIVHLSRWMPTFMQVMFGSTNGYSGIDLSSMMDFWVIQYVFLAGRTFVWFYLSYKCSLEILVDEWINWCLLMTPVCYFPFHVVCILFIVILDSRKSLKNSSPEHTMTSCTHISTYTFAASIQFDDLRGLFNFGDYAQN
jgi:hypothetical protein